MPNAKRAESRAIWGGIKSWRTRPELCMLTARRSIVLSLARKQEKLTAKGSVAGATCHTSRIKHSSCVCVCAG